MPSRAKTLMMRLEDKARRGHRGDPVATVAFYGPDDQRATKIVVGISPSPAAGITETRIWRGDTDVREDAGMLAEVLAFLSEKQTRSLVVTDGIYGCPHEEGVDYPEGEACAACAFWRGRDRTVPLIG
jgi:hypothetical protein